MTEIWCRKPFIFILLLGSSISSPRTRAFPLKSWNPNCPVSVRFYRLQKFPSKPLKWRCTDVVFYKFAWANWNLLGCLFNFQKVVLSGYSRSENTYFCPNEIRPGGFGIPSKRFSAISMVFFFFLLFDLVLDSVFHFGDSKLLQKAPESIFGSIFCDSIKTTQNQELYHKVQANNIS